MKKFLCLIMALIIPFSFASCAQNTGEDEDTAKNVNLEEIMAEMKTAFPPEESHDLSKDGLIDLYGIDASDVKASACYFTTVGVFPEEIIMLEAKDKEAFDRIEEKLNIRIESVKVQSKDYDPENYEIAQRCEVITHGNYLAMFISPNFDGLADIFNSHF